MELQAEVFCGQLDFFPRWRGSLCIPQKRNAGEFGNRFLEQLEPFATQLCSNGAKSREISAGSARLFTETGPDRIVAVKKRWG